MNPGKLKLYINFGLLAAVLALSIVLWLAPEPDTGLKPFAHINADTLSRIEISVPRLPPAQLQRRDGAWHALAPAAAELDAQRLRNLLNLLHESTEPGYEAAHLELKEFGLDPPAATLKLDEHSFQFGASEPLSRRRYVLYSGKLYLLADTHYPLLSRGIGNLLKQPSASVVGEAGTN
jgi:hypothetical protein